MKNRIAPLFLLLVFCGTAVADQITLKNGDRVTGTIVKSDGKTLVFNGALVGEVTIALENIAEIVTDKPLYVGLSDGRTIEGVLNVNADRTEIKASKETVTASGGN